MQAYEKKMKPTNINENYSKLHMHINNNNIETAHCSHNLFHFVVVVVVVVNVIIVVLVARLLFVCDCVVRSVALLNWLLYGSLLPLSYAQHIITNGQSNNSSSCSSKLQRAITLPLGIRTSEMMVRNFSLFNRSL